MPPTGTDNNNERFLERELIEAELIKIMNPFLAFEDVIPKIKTTSKSVTFRKQTVSASSDTNKVKPRLRSTSSQFSYVNIEGLSTESGVLNPYGFATRIDRDAVNFVEGIDEIKEAFNTIGFWLAEDINNNIISALQTNATGPLTKFGDPTDWSESGANPVNDLRHMSEDMRQEGYPYRLTDTYVHDDNWYEADEYVLFLDNRKIDATVDIGADNQNNRLNINKLPNMTLWGLLSGMTEGDVLGLDRNNSAGTFYWSVDPKFQVTRADGTTSPIQINRFTDNETHDEIIQVWLDYVTVVKRPNAVIYGSQLI